MADSGTVSTGMPFLRFLTNTVLITVTSTLRGGSGFSRDPRSDGDGRLGKLLWGNHARILEPQILPRNLSVRGT